MDKSITLLMTLLFVVYTINLSSQVCFDSYTTEECPYLIIGEFAISTQLKTLTNRSAKPDFALNLGIQKSVTNRLSFGIHAFANLLLDGNNTRFQSGLRPRIAHLIDPEIELSFSPGLILTNSLDGLAKTKGFSFESNISYKNKLGLALRIDHHNFETKVDETVINIGLQTHGSTTFYTVGGVVIGGGLLVLVLKGIFGV